MRRLAGVIVGGALWMGAAQAQADWVTGGGDAQRSSWVRTDAKIATDSMAKPGFQVLWKVKTDSTAPPVLLNRYIGYRGFRSLAFVAGSSDSIVAIDTDLGRVEWRKRVVAGASQPGGCGAMAAQLTRPATVEFPAAGGGRGGGGAGRAARGAAGEPEQGAVTLQAVAGATRAAARAPVRGLAAARAPAGGAFGRAANLLYALSSDGMFHSMYVSNGDEPQPAIRFVPANARAAGLIVVDNVAYAATTGGCGGAPDAVWALDLASKQVTSWKPGTGGIVGSEGAAFGADGTLYVATSTGDLVALEPKTLKVKDAYRAGQGFTGTPVVFPYQGSALIAAATEDGRLRLLDDAKMRGASLPADAAGFAPGALASWQDLAGTRWVAAPVGTGNSGAIAAWKIGGADGALTCETGWTSRDIPSPLTPMIVNGVVFALSGGASPAVLYALDAANGKELWNSGKAITAAARGGGLSGGATQLYLGTNDGTFYAFGFPMEH